MASQVIPIIDFNAYSLEKEGVSHEELQMLSGDICNAFSTVGFCYLKNHGLSQESIDRYHGLFKTFFKLDTETKLRYQTESFAGYRPLKSDRFNQARPARDMVEAFVLDATETKWPEEVPQLRNEITRFRKRVIELALRVLDVISSTFCKEDRQLIRRCHEAMLIPSGIPESYPVLRANFYPEVEQSDVREGQIRLGEHSDFGTLTVLFLDGVSGLEVKTRGGEYIPVPHIPGTAVINIGDMMQRWTADKLIAAKHRVVFPGGKEAANERQSLALFCGPDMDAEIRCLDGSNKYKPITMKKYIAEVLKQVTKE